MSFDGLHNLLGSQPGSTRLQCWLSSLANDIKESPLELEIKAYPGIVYHNYPCLGLSLEYVQTKADRASEELLLDAIHIYNRQRDHGEILSKTFSRYPALPITLLRNEDPNQPTIKVTVGMTGKEYVEALGEPTRKGGGHGPSSGSINMWCEWTSLGIMVEFGGTEARGPDAWDRGGNAVWEELTIFTTSK
jgi:hypothetical protein